jgi:uncharacterized protein YoxC
VVQASLGKKQDPISKITRVKRVGGMAQAVQHLSSKFKVLSSNFSNTKKKKNQMCSLIVHLKEWFLKCFLHIVFLEWY